MHTANKIFPHMRLACLLVLLLQVSAVAGNSRIEAFTRDLGGKDWKEGVHWPMHLSEKASPKDVIDAYIKTQRGVDRFITSYEIVAAEKVVTPLKSLSGDYTAVLIKSNLGDMIFLMENNGAEWWVKAFAIK